MTGWYRTSGPIADELPADELTLPRPAGFLNALRLKSKELACVRFEL
jgi:hypothetical protein